MIQGETCIRDYIHVTDLANAHILLLNILRRKDSDVFNLGNGSGFLVKMIESARRLLDMKFSKNM